MSSPDPSLSSTADGNGPLWGARAEAWAEQETQSRPMYEAAIRLTRIRGGLRVLDVGCGAGSFCALASARGARVAGLDASDRLLAIARRRVPDGEFRRGSLESPPYDDDAFDVVTGFNAFQFAADPVSALAEAGRVTRPSGAVLACVWGRPERVELSIVMRAVSALAPVSSGRARTSLSEPGALESAMAGAGLALEETGVGTLAFEWPDRESMLQGLTSAGGMVRIARTVGDDALEAAVVGVMERFRATNGGYRLQNEWRYALASAEGDLPDAGRSPSIFAAKGGAMDEFKQRQRAMWGAGDYPTLAEHLVGAGELVVERAGVRPGARVLDVACGPGTATLPAARVGAEVTGLDLSPELLDAGRTKAAEHGVEVEWVEGDAEALPFEDGTFHHVISTFGHMFAPRHAVTAAEMTRVCADDGVIAMACWTPEGVGGRTFAVSGPYMPPPPEYASPPILWGTEDYVREMFGSVASDFSFERNDVVLEWDSLEGFADYFSSHFPVLVTAQRLLGDRWADLRADLVELWHEANEADDGSLRFRQEYLVSVVRF